MTGTPAGTPLDRIHERHAGGRRLRILARALAPHLPHGARVLDVGCGDGRLARTILDARPDLAIEGVEVVPRPATHIKVEPFDGRTLPHPDCSFDAVVMVDVLHHAGDAEALLLESSRVARRVVIKDHGRDGLFARRTLQFMDWVGNARYGIPVPDDYWPRQRWRDTFARLSLGVEAFDDVALFAPPLSWIFGRRLHFVASVTRR